MFYIRDQFVDGRIATAKALVMDCVVVTQHRNCIAQLDKAVYGECVCEREREREGGGKRRGVCLFVFPAQNPFYMKETREIFRQLFGPPTDKKTFMKVTPSSPPPLQLSTPNVCVCVCRYCVDCLCI